MSEGVEVLWREFIEDLILARDKWEEFSEEAQEMPTLDNLPVKTQEVLSRVSIWSNFGNALDAIIAYAGSQGGLEVFLIDEPLKEEEEEND